MQIRFQVKDIPTPSKLISEDDFLVSRVRTLLEVEYCFPRFTPSRRADLSSFLPLASVCTTSFLVLASLADN